MRTTLSSVRLALASDAANLLTLMRELAVFEKYIAQFCVTEADLLERGLRADSARQFTAFLAEASNGQLLGYAVVYPVPFTFDLRPNLVLKELFVRETARGLGVGQALMTTVVAHAKQQGCARLKWDVMPTNTRAKTFYRRIGGVPDSAWENWIRQC
ncbi:GNAT family N-acetyltransferase [Solimicrobium silvestre]|uniref:Acetyltransferase (GNAT) family n=1 Tax=Solimicrobium silvestre TaxID=2099400 RepID=A0A2S9GZV3_9BURK|nr:GNAT family N-acetyltransferase [Solimicrobium silvestre]PRC93228.1 Acetyltransferase (GNAT) family [Solimicrobium silvestre]